MRKLSYLILLVLVVALAGCAASDLGMKKTPTLTLAELWDKYAAVTEAVTRLGSAGVLTLDDMKTYREYRRDARKYLELAEGFLVNGNMEDFRLTKAKAYEVLLMLNNFVLDMEARNASK